MKRLALSALGIYLAACSISLAVELKRIDEAKATSLFAAYLKQLGKSADDYEVSLQAFGKSTWIVRAHHKQFSFPVPWRHVIDSRGEVKELSLDSLNVVFQNEYPSSPKQEDRNKLIQDFVSLLDGGVSTVISKTADIPGYDKAPLDPDISETVRAPFSFGIVISVVYTYQQLPGGIVRRYRFRFKSGTEFEGMECSVLAVGIGEAKLYE
jgi:hypothetical protein